ncbi:uncharacterized membrane protein [Desulfosporosinus acidiphilus SJ4]|uniref:Uncharacterized membrane protein n=1 Tax=Desulfosporosinus acidiphilus (strain DSM 22704 / JCM 16185 / SJ4) TaxID=646529 RepID=I4D2L2_DESAJ|nr:ElyC/SanA/YdcF family protein [Desulfosporosinus acidiphilus]AFM40036.1 uncharacterized membrane protein [Desulfosporosinus acidiphilus SJ4]
MDLLKLKKWLPKLVIIFLIISGLLGCTALSINHYVEGVGSKYILKVNDIPSVDAILVLGAYVAPDGTPSPMLGDRLSEGYELYEQGKAPKLLVSGDHGRKNYDEVNAMKTYLMNKGIPGRNIFMDHAGFSTYESIYRAKDIFEVRKVIIVTQEYHLMRAVFLARAMGLEAYGVASDKHNYGEVMAYYNLREIAARNKDFLWAKVFKPKPTYLGDTIPVFGDGDATNDK